MWDYTRATTKHLGVAARDVLFVSVISLAPLLFGRLVLVYQPSDLSKGSYFDFLSNGQLSFYSMGSLAAILLACLTKRLPEHISLFIGLFSILALFFLMVLVGKDPTLNASSFGFVGWMALILYVSTQFVRVLVDAMKKVDAPEALGAGKRVDDKLAASLAARKGGSSDE